jgi:hypothetical protein
MEIKNRSIVTAGAILTAFLFIKANCTKLPFDCAKTVYSFQLSVKASPDKDTINVGDTIWLEINEPTLIRDGISGEMIDYSGTSNLGSALSFSFRDTVINQWVDAANRFKFSLEKGVELRVTQLVVEYQFFEENQHFRFKAGIIPQQKGLHRLLFSSSNNTFRSTDKCTKASFAINFKETNHNRHLVGYTGPDVPGGDLNFYVK